MKSFDLTDNAFAKITKDAHAERTRLSVHAPKNAGGLTFYIWFVSLLREYLINLNRGWVGRTVDGLEIVENEERKIRIAYVHAESLDEALITSHRGPASLAAAYRNGQLLSSRRNTSRRSHESGRAKSGRSSNSRRGSSRCSR